MYSDELASKICRYVAEGYSLRQIGDLPQMPHKRTMKRWLAEKPTFQERYAQAKEEMAEHFAEEILEIADDGSNDWIEREVESGKTIKVVDHEHIARSRLRVDTRKWLMSKLMPQKYGQKLDVNTHIDLVARLTAMTPAERLARAEELLQGAASYLPLLEAQENARADRLESESEGGEPADESEADSVPDAVETTRR
jgi:histone H3/H4